MAWLQPRPGGLYIDGTVGMGGHAEAILERSSPDGRLLAIDRDPQALDLAQQRLAAFGDRVVFERARFDAMAEVAARHGFAGVQGVLLDLGVSSLQLSDAERGFSFQQEGPLGMRMGPDAPATADEIVNTWPEVELARIIYTYGEERRSRRVARAIVAARHCDDARSRHVVRGRRAGGAHLRRALSQRADPPGHAHLSGPAHRRQRRARGAGGGPAPGGGAAGAGRPAGGDRLSLAGGSHRQAVHGARVDGLRVPAPATAVHLRPSRHGATPDAQAGDGR